MPIRTFSSFSFDEVEELFQISRDDGLPLLENWLSVTPDNTQEANLNRLKNHLLRQILAWNEDELKMFFIGPLIELADLETDRFKPFTQRQLSAKLGEIEVSGKVDFMIAAGKRSAKPPYFCIHEYKQEIGSEGEPLGQVLIAMLAAQKLNDGQHPILGAYIVGRNWFFTVLSDSKYALSLAYDATTEDIFSIYGILQKSKSIIQSFLSIP